MSNNPIIWREAELRAFNQPRAPLQKWLALGEGFDPPGNPEFAALLRGSKALTDAIAHLHRDFPAIGEDFYFIVNSQLENMDGDRIINASKLAAVKIGVLRLP